jgi:uncharacterized HAD superfamily protein
LKIAIDIDGVLLNLDTLFKYAFTYFNEEYYPATDWDMTNYPDHVRNLVFMMFEDENIMTTFLPFKDNMDDIKNKFELWKDKRHELYILSKRFEVISERTKHFIACMFPRTFKKVIVIQGSKIDYMKEYNLDILIDDSPKNIQECLDNKIDCIMISDDNQVYNHFMRDKVKWYKSILGVEL